MGSNGSSQGPQIIQAPRNIGPLEESLVAHSQLMLDGTGQFAGYGGGHRLVPQALMGQVIVPGMNPTAYGNASDYAPAQQYFGQSSLPNGGGGMQLGSLFPTTQQQTVQPPQQQLQLNPNLLPGLQQLAMIAPGLFNMSAFQQPAQANAGGQPQQQQPPAQQQIQPQQQLAAATPQQKPQQDPATSGVA